MTSSCRLECAARRALWLAGLGASAALISCGTDRALPTAALDAAAEAGTSVTNATPLTLVNEKKLAKLLGAPDVDHYEASGIVVSGGQLYVASDNLTRIAAIDPALDHGSLGPGDLIQSQYEAITATDDGRFYAMIESDDASDTRAQVAELDASTAFVSQAFTDTSFDHVNKGFEGLAWLRLGGSEYLLALCENNACKDDDSPPGQGRVRVLSLVDGTWTTQAKLKLPSSAAFLNYSDLALDDHGDGTYAAAVVSRKSATLWLGTLTTSPWALSGASSFYSFPRTDEGAILYCAVEGVTFLGPDVLAFASDKGDGSTACNDKDESVHIFQLPH